MERYFDSDVVGILETSAEGRIVRANAGAVRLLGFSQKELCTRTWMDLVHPADLGKVRDHFNPHLASESLAPVLEVRHITKKGDTRVVSLNLRTGPISRDGRPDYIVAFLMDISEQRRAEANLGHLHEMLGQLLNDTLALRDAYTAGHQNHVADYACSICCKMGLSETTRKYVGAAANIHDIGKIAIPSEYLSKPTKLTEIEWTVIKTHAQQSYNILRPIETEFPIAEIVYQHHERLDGSGYPRGLKDGQILLEAQIIAAADTADSIINARPYRRALGAEWAIKVLQQERGVRLLPDVADACVETIRR